MKKLLSVLLVASAIANAKQNVFNRVTRTFKPDTVFLGSTTKADKSSGEVVVSLSKDAENFGSKLLTAVHAPLKKNLEVKRNAEGVVLNCVQGSDWNDVANAARELVVNAAGSEFISSKLYDKAIYKLAKSIKANCGIWSTKEEVIEAVNKADLSFLAKKNAKFLKTKKA